MEYRGPGSAGLDTGSDMVPPTPAFPISPPTPYGEALAHTHTYTHIPAYNIHTPITTDTYVPRPCDLISVSSFWLACVVAMVTLTETLLEIGMQCEVSCNAVTQP